jgi:hypothetical protein
VSNASEALIAAINSTTGSRIDETDAAATIHHLQTLGYYLAPLTTSAGPTARASDPRTSKAYDAAKMRKGTQGHLLLLAFSEVPTDGLTDEEAMQHAEGVSPTSEYAKRCSDLRSAGLIVDTGVDRKGSSGLDRIVSRITDKGWAVLRGLAQ